MSQAVGIEHAHSAVWLEGYTGLIVSRNQKAAIEVIRYAKTAVKTSQFMPKNLKILVDNKTSLELSNGSRIEAVSASLSAGRSMAASKVTIDEFAVMQHAPDIYQAISPTLSAGGALDVLFSPKGRANMAYMLWNGELGGAYSRHKIHWTRNPAFYTLEEQATGIKPEDCRWYRAERPKYTAEAWAEEYECDFRQSGQAVFLEDNVETMFSHDISMEDYYPTEDYVTFWDIGRHRDATVGITLRIMRDPMTGRIKKRVVKYERGEGWPYPVIASKIDERFMEYPGKHYVESNSIGDPVLSMTDSPAEGAYTSQKSKVNMITALQLDLERGDLESPLVPQLRAELLAYQWDDDGLVQDSVIALSGACLKSNESNADFTPASGGEREMSASVGYARLAGQQNGMGGVYNPFAGAGAGYGSGPYR